jgi:hypothetical protein
MRRAPTDWVSPAGRPTAASQLAGLAHLHRIAGEQLTRAMSQVVPSLSITIPFERIHDAVPEPDVARGEGRHRLAVPAVLIRLGWRRGKNATES